MRWGTPEENDYAPLVHLRALGWGVRVQNKETVTSERNSACGGACAASAQQSEKSKPKKRIGLRTKLQKRAFSAYEHKHWILMRAERAGALPGHARSALAGHRTRGAR